MRYPSGIMRSDETLRPDLVEGPRVGADVGASDAGDGLSDSETDSRSPSRAKLIRIATMTRAILEEVRVATPDESRAGSHLENS